VPDGPVPGAPEPDDADDEHALVTTSSNASSTPAAAEVFADARARMADEATRSRPPSGRARRAGQDVTGQ
jgi:hypothetical protein